MGGVAFPYEGTEGICSFLHYNGGALDCEYYALQGVLYFGAKALPGTGTLGRAPNVELLAKIDGAALGCCGNGDGLARLYNLQCKLGESAWV